MSKVTDFREKNADILKNARVYILSIHEVNEYRDTVDEDIPSIEFLEGLTEKQVQAIVANSDDEKSDVYTLEQFIAEFNWAVDEPISSDTYYLRFFA